MKYVILSFDDGRKDFYTNAFPILKKNGLVATLNVVTSFIGRNDLAQCGNGFSECVSWEELDEMHEYGIEIANHSANHTNIPESIIRGAQELIEHFQSPKVGFASPTSAISDTNIEEFSQISKYTSYIRSGNQVRRDGTGHMLLYALYRATNSQTAFQLYNRRNFIDCSKPAPSFYPSVTSSSDNSMAQLLCCIDKLPDEHALIVLLHSILQKDEYERANDRWSNSTSEFEELCRQLSNKMDLQVITNAELDSLCKLA